LPKNKTTLNEKASLVLQSNPSLTQEQALAYASDATLFRNLVNPDTTVVETQEGQILINKQTGAPIANLGRSPDRATKVNVQNLIPTGGTSVADTNTITKNWETEIAPIAETLEVTNKALAFAKAAKDNPSASAALDTAVADLIRGDGRLSNQAVDMVRNADADFAQRLGDKLSVFFRGKPTDITLKDKVRILEIIRDQSAPKYNKAVSRFKKVWGTTPAGKNTIEALTEGRESFEVSTEKPTTAEDYFKSKGR
jgi:hypothetical protein